SPLDRVGRDAVLSAPQCCWPTTLQGRPHGSARCISTPSLSAPADVVRIIRLWTVRHLLAVGARPRPLIPRLSDSVPDLSHCAPPVGPLLCRGDLAYALGGRWHYCAWRLSPGKDLTSCISKHTVCSL